MPNISVHVDEATFNSVTQLAKMQDRSKSWVVTAALKPFLEHNAWMIEETKRTLAEVDAGTAVLHDHDDVMRIALARAKKLDQ